MHNGINRRDSLKSSLAFGGALAGASGLGFAENQKSLVFEINLILWWKRGSAA
jgi:hypothetical protein